MESMREKTLKEGDGQGGVNPWEQNRVCEEQHRKGFVKNL
jgi:hypothetical protein